MMSSSPVRFTLHQITRNLDAPTNRSIYQQTSFAVRQCSRIWLRKFIFNETDFRFREIKKRLKIKDKVLSSDLAFTFLRVECCPTFPERLTHSRSLSLTRLLGRRRMRNLLFLTSNWWLFLDNSVIDGINRLTTFENFPLWRWSINCTTTLNNPILHPKSSLIKLKLILSLREQNKLSCRRILINVNAPPENPTEKN